MLIFEGEDLEYQSRTRQLQKTLKAQFDQQIKEKQSSMLSSRQQESRLHQEYMHMNSIFGQREEQYRAMYRRKLEDMQFTNMRLAREKKERLDQEKRTQLEAENQLHSELSRRRTTSRKGF